MSNAKAIHYDVVIFGGSASGLWILHRLHQAGYRVLLIEANRLGQGQTIACQGIIHGGLKYTLHGVLTPSAEAIREMPAIWRRCLQGEHLPQLDGVLRADYCHLWRSNTLRGRLGLIGARHGLRIQPVELEHEAWPLALAQVKGDVFRLDEQVISPAALIRSLAAPLMDSIILAPPHTVRCEAVSDTLTRIHLHAADTRSSVQVQTRFVVLAGGVGNAALRQALGLSASLLQIRSVHMLLARGRLPVLNGHCIEGNTTKVTITTDHDKDGRVVWQIGGQLSEQAVNWDSDALIQHGRIEVAAALGNYDLSGVEWATYRADKAEVVTPGGQRPDAAFLKCDANIITVWPTKLALVPDLAQQVYQAIHAAYPPSGAADANDAWRRAGWPAPDFALPPWETVAAWTTVV